MTSRTRASSTTKSKPPSDKEVKPKRTASRKPKAEIIQLRPSTPVPTVIGLPESDARRLKAIEARLDGLQRALGAKREEYARLETRMLSDIDATRREYGQMIMSLAARLGVDLAAENPGERWAFDPVGMGFTKTSL